MDPISTHYCTPIDLPVAEARRADVAYVALYRAGYDEHKRRSITQIASTPWPDAAWDDAVQTIRRWAETEAASNTGDEAEFELQVMGATGVQRITTKRFHCRAIIGAPAAETPLSDLPPEGDATLEQADALAAAPGLRAVMAGAMQGARLNEFLAKIGMQSFESLAGMWHREFERLTKENNQLRSDRDKAWTSYHELAHQMAELLEAMGPQAPAPAVSPETVENAIAEVGGTLKTVAMHWLGAPSEMGDLVKAFTEAPAAVRQRLIDPRVAAALRDPAKADLIAAALSSL